MSNRLAVLTLATVLLAGAVHPGVGTPPDADAQTWRFELPSAAGAQYRSISPRWCPRPGRWSSAWPGWSRSTTTWHCVVRRRRRVPWGGRARTVGGESMWTGRTTAVTFPSNRFLVYHELGHAVWGLLLTSDDRRAFGGAVTNALHGRRCVNDQGDLRRAAGDVRRRVRPICRRLRRLHVLLLHAAAARHQYLRRSGRCAARHRDLGRVAGVRSWAHRRDQGPC